MTAQHVSAPLAAPDMDTALDALRSRGLRVSAARRLVLEALFTADRPVRAEQIAGGLGGRVPRSDLASAYRNLETLEAVGLVRHFHVGHGPGLYGLAGATEPEYLVCESCGAVRTVDLDDVRSLIKTRFRYEATFNHFPVIGLCADCADGKPAPRDAEEASAS